MLARRLAGAALVLASSIASVAALRRAYRPSDAPAPQFRKKGSGARLTVVEFSDFECPHCKAAEADIRNFLAVYGPEATFVFKSYPIERFHPWARKAAMIAECAGRQGKFWPVHDSFYEHQEQWAQSATVEADLKRLAAREGVDGGQLDACLADPSIPAAIEADIRDAKDRWVYSTPTFFVNGKRFIGGYALATAAPIWIEKHSRK